MKLIILAITVLCVIKSQGQTTCNNPLKSIFTFSGPATAEVASGIQVCKSLKNVASCCNVDTFNSIQTKTNELLTSLREKVVARDQVMADIRRNVIPSIKSSLERIKAASDKMKQQTGAISASDSNDFSEFVKVLDEMGEMKTKFMNYQKSRTSCVVQMVKLQAATWCLACDPNWATKGVAADGTVTLSTNVCNRIANTCFDYISGTVEQSGLIMLKIMAPLFDKIATALEKLSNGDASGATDLMNAFADSATIPFPADDTSRPVKRPRSCTRESCPFLCSTVFRGATVNLDILAKGGEAATKPEEAVEFGRLLLSAREEEEEHDDNTSTRRVLQGSGSFEFDDDEAGVTVTFEDDPGNANADPAFAGLIRVGLAAFVGLVATLIL